MLWLHFTFTWDHLILPKVDLHLSCSSLRMDHTSRLFVIQTECYLQLSFHEYCYLLYCLHIFCKNQNINLHLEYACKQIATSGSFNSIWIIHYTDLYFSILIIMESCSQFNNLSLIWIHNYVSIFEGIQTLPIVSSVMFIVLCHERHLNNNIC